MRKITYILVLMVLFIININAQSLRLIRTDVDTAHSDFVTATFLFGFDIQLDSIKNCVGFSYQIHYNQVNYITYSQCWLPDFPNVQPNIFSQVDKINNLGILNIAAPLQGTGDSVGYINPKTVHLEFAVSQTAPNNQNLTFQIIKSIATILTDSGRQNINIPTSSFVYNIHGFIDVWPGDANNDGTVDNSDWASINQYLGIGAGLKSQRSYRRENASTLWTAQRVLTWDSAAVTYVDCDGNGLITPTDLLIVTMNYGSNHSSTEKSNNQIQSENKSIQKPIITPNSVLLPIKTNCPQPFLGVAGSISFESISNDYNIIGITDGNMIGGANNLLWYSVDNENNILNFAYSGIDKANEAIKSGILINVVAEPKSQLSTPSGKPILIQCTAANRGGIMFELNQVTGVEEQSASTDDYTLISNGDYYEIDLNSRFSGNNTLRLYNILGEELISLNSQQNGSNNFFIDKRFLIEGRYFIKISTSQKNIFIEL